MKESIKEMIKNSFVLMLIMIFSVSSLSFVYSITSPLIKEQEQSRFERMLGDAFHQDVSYKLKGAYKDGVLLGEYYEVSDSFDQLIGYGVIVSEKGYQSDIELLLVFDVGKRIYSVKVLKQLETPGIGSKITEDSFLSQFKGKQLSEILLVRDGGKIDAVSGATISTSAVIKGIRGGFSKLP